MRFLIFLFLFCSSLVAASQKKYHCEYKGTISFPMPDSILKSIQRQIEEKGLPAGVAEQLFEQIRSKDISSEYRREIVAGHDSTFILVTNNETSEGDITMNLPDTKLLFRKGKLYAFDSLNNRFFANPLPEPKKIFNSTGSAKMIMNHSCSVYISTDSSYLIWVAADLPSYINPGIIVGDIKGAILSFEKKLKDHTVKSEIYKIEKLDQLR